MDNALWSFGRPDHHCCSQWDRYAQFEYMKLAEEEEGGMDEGAFHSFLFLFCLIFCLSSSSRAQTLHTSSLTGCCFGSFHSSNVVHCLLRWRPCLCVACRPLCCPAELSMELEGMSMEEMTFSREYLRQACPSPGLCRRFPRKSLASASRVFPVPLFAPPCRSQL